MGKLCNKIVITSFYGWGTHPQYSDRLTINKEKISYNLTVEVMGQLKEKTSSELYLDKVDHFVDGLDVNDLFRFVEKTEFKIEEEMLACDGGSISLILCFDDGSSREIRAPGEEIQYSCPKLFEFFMQLSSFLRGSSIRPKYLEFEDVVYVCDEEME